MVYLPVLLFIHQLNSVLQTHLSLARQFLAAGKAVLCEKPLCMTLAETEELVSLARSSGTFLMEAIWSRCLPVYQVESENQYKFEGCSIPLKLELFWGGVGRSRLSDLGLTGSTELAQSCPECCQYPTLVKSTTLLACCDCITMLCSTFCFEYPT